MICEICSQEEATENINLGLDVGYHLGDYGKKGYKMFKVKPTCIKIISIYLCRGCKSKIESNKYFNVDVTDELKDLLKTALTKNMIIEALQ